MTDFKELARLPGTPQEQLWLAERLQTLSAKETILLSAALEKKPAQTAADAVRHFITLPDYEVCSPAGNHEQLGRFYLHNECAVARELHAYIDLEKLGLRYEAEHLGAFIGSCYVQYPTRDPTLQYDGTNLDKFTDDGWSVKLKLATSQHPSGVWLCLPDYSDAGDGRPDEIRLALDALGADTIQECRILDARCILPQIENLMPQYASLADLIYDGQNLGFALDERGQGMPQFGEKLAAALEYTGCHRMDEALDIIQNLHCFDFVPANSLPIFAIAELKKQGNPLAENSLAECFDFEAYAVELLERRGFELTADKQFYVGRNSQAFIPEYHVEQLPSLHLE